VNGPSRADPSPDLTRPGHDDSEPPGSGGHEQSAQHGKRAVLVASVLGALVVGGLVVDALRVPAKAAAPAAAEAAKPPVPQDPFVDFEARQKLEAARLDSERQRKAALAQAEAQARRDRPAPRDEPADPAAPPRKTAEDGVREEARLEDLKRSLAAIKSQDMVVANARAEADVRAPAGAASGAGGRRADGTLQRLRQAIDRVRQGGAGGGTGSGGGAGGTAGETVGDLATPFVRDLPSGQASGAVVGQSASRRRERGEGRREGEYVVPVGTVMAAVLDMEVNSDWEGRWRAMVSRDIYDIHQDVILIPKGTRVLGTSVRPKLVNEAINERMGLAAQWLVLPNGARIDLTRSAMLDAGGVAAIDGDVNRHVLATLGGVVAYGVIGGWGAVEAAKRTDQNNAATAVGLLSGQRSAGAEIAQGLADIGKRVAARYLNLVPTITLRPGTPMNVFLDDEMVLQAWAPIDEFAPAVAQRP
jgi:type IV secretory pathway VirB10-like protein